MLTIVIPTFNRHSLLRELLIKLHSLTYIDAVIVVDSSENALTNIPHFTNFKFKYIRSEIASAAVQRNIGIEATDVTCNYLAFLDDDVIPSETYFQNLISELEAENFVGISGLAINSNKFSNSPRVKRTKSVFHRLFLLDSDVQGKLLLSGVNVPVRIPNRGACSVDWLIGCSIWKYERIGNTRFEKDFIGASLGEDVIFSFRMSKKGKLAVHSNVILNHLESDIERVQGIEFWEMWMKYRFRLVEVRGKKKSHLAAYWWSSIGQFLILLLKQIFRRDEYKSYKGIIRGALKLGKS